MIAALTPLLTSLGPLALLVVMAVVLAETGLLVGFFLPGDSLLFTTGVLAAAGVVHLPVAVVIAAVALAATCGDQIGFLAGRRFGPRLLARSTGRWLKADHVERTQLFFARHGSRAVMLARFVPVVRTLTPVVAGAAAMSHRRFVVYNVIGGVGWTSLMVGAGFLLGGVPWVAAHVELIAIGLVAASLVPAVLAAVVRRVRGPRGPRGSVPREPTNDGVETDELASAA